MNKAHKGPPADAAIFGATGFIGTHVLKRLLKAGLRVNVMSRTAQSRPSLFHDERVHLFAGEMTTKQDVDYAIQGTKYVIDLVHSHSPTWDYQEKVIIAGVRTVAEACLRHGVERFVFASTINVFYLGRRNAVITGATATDLDFKRRGIYCNSKATSERLLMAMHKEQGLPVCILRPGIVIGEGGRPYHGGIAGFLNMQNCIMQSKGAHPLPFVLVEDCAEAFYLALLKSESVGRCYNVVGDVRLTGREYIEELSRVLERPIHIQTQALWRMKSRSIIKWIIKRLLRQPSPLVSFRVLETRGLYGRFDNEDIKSDLGWTPVTDRAEFINRGIGVHKKRD